MFGRFKRKAPNPDPVPAPKADVPAPPPEPPGECISILFSDVAGRLPGALAPRAPVPGSFPVSVKTILAQLPSGAVRIRFGQLHQAAPPGAFPDDAGLDETPVDLPLPKVLAALKPSDLACRPGQKTVAVGENIPNLFVKPPALVPPAPAPGSNPTGTSQ